MNAAPELQPPPTRFATTALTALGLLTLTGFFALIFATPAFAESLAATSAVVGAEPLPVVLAGVIIAGHVRAHRSVPHNDMARCIRALASKRVIASCAAALSVR